MTPKFHSIKFLAKSMDEIEYNFIREYYVRMCIRITECLHMLMNKLKLMVLIVIIGIIMN